VFTERKDNEIGAIVELRSTSLLTRHAQLGVSGVKSQVFLIEEELQRVAVNILHKCKNTDLHFRHRLCHARVLCGYAGLWAYRQGALSNTNAFIMPCITVSSAGLAQFCAAYS
jgi:hypothetical protein